MFRCSRCGSFHLRFFKKEAQPFEFTGLNMISNAYTPWRAGGGDKVSKEFLATDQKVVDGVWGGG